MAFVANIRLPTQPIQFDEFDVVFQEKTIKGSLVASMAHVQEMLKIVDKFEIRSHCDSFFRPDAGTAR